MSDRNVPHERQSNGDNDCCCCLKARFQPWHGPRCPHAFGGTPEWREGLARLHSEKAGR